MKTKFVESRSTVKTLYFGNDMRILFDESTERGGKRLAFAIEYANQHDSRHRGYVIELGKERANCHVSRTEVLFGAQREAGSVEMYDAIIKAGPYFELNGYHLASKSDGGQLYNDNTAYARIYAHSVNESELAVLEDVAHALWVDLDARLPYASDSWSSSVEDRGRDMQAILLNIALDALHAKRENELSELLYRHPPTAERDPSITKKSMELTNFMKRR